MDVSRLVLAAESDDAADGGGGIDAEQVINEALDNAPDTPSEALEVVTQKMGSLWTGLLESLPILLIGLIVFLLALVVALVLARGVESAVNRTGADPVAGRLLSRIARAALVSVAALFALSVIGVSVANVLTLIAVLGFAIGLAIQGILQNFVAGVILLLRKPFKAGDQIVSGDFEGTVTDIDFRVTTLVAYDGTKQLVPNGQVYDSPLVNLTWQGMRRTSLAIGIDYRDDHHAARDVIRAAVEASEGVLASPEVEVLMSGLGDSSVDYDVRYWTAPTIKEVRHTQDRVLGNVKTAIEEAGMTIPWPIRTLVVDGDVPVVDRRPS